MKLLIIVSLMLSAKLSLTKMSSMDRLLQPAVAQQDDWYLYFDRIFSLSLLERTDTPCECSLCDLKKYDLGCECCSLQKTFKSLKYDSNLSSFHGL